MKCEQLSIYVEANWHDVYDFVRDGGNLPSWARGLAQTEPKRDAYGWAIESRMGPLNLRFVEINSYGVLDHWVTDARENTYYNPMRVVPNGTGSQVTFTVFQQHEVTDDQFIEDCAQVGSDLRNLADLFQRFEDPSTLAERAQTDSPF